MPHAVLPNRFRVDLARIVEELTRHDRPSVDGADWIAAEREALWRVRLATEAEWLGGGHFA